MKKYATSNVRRRVSEAGLYSTMDVKESLLRNYNNVKRNQWFKVHKDWTKVQWNTFLLTDQSKFEILGQKLRFLFVEKLVREMQPPVSYKL